jgi:hypothetical protein
MHWLRDLDLKRKIRNPLGIYLLSFMSLIRHSNQPNAAKVNVRQGRAIAQAVSRRLPTAAARVQTRVWSCGIL